MSNAEPAEPPPVPEFLDPETALARIEALTTTARNTWLLLIGFLAFIGLTLLSVRDVDFFSVSATIDLPIVNIAIPTATFFWTAALLAAILHTYFQVFLLKLWDALAEAPPEIGKLTLGDRVFPWLVNDWALRRRADRPVTSRPMDLLGSAVTALLIWGATPILLAGFWLRSLPAHDARLSLVIAAALWLSVFASLRSEYRARTRLSRPGLGDWRHRRSARGLRARLDQAANDVSLVFSTLALVATVPVLTTVTIAGAGGHHLPAVFENTVARIWPETWGKVPIASADLIDAEIAIRPVDWRDPEIARRRFRVDWCADAGIPEHACEKPRHPDQELARQRWCDTWEIEDCAGRFREIDRAFAAEWQIEWEAYLGTIRGPDLRNRDLRNAVAHGAFLVSVDLRSARLDGTELFAARLDGADLTGARLGGANLSEARLGGAELVGTQLAKANMWGTKLTRANLSFAALEGAILWNAGLEEATLWDTQLGGADLRGARLDGANLSLAQLEGADLYGARLDGVNLSNTTLAGANLSKGTLGRFVPAVLKKDSFIIRSWQEHSNLVRTRLTFIEAAGARFGPLTAHSADFSGVKNLTQRQLAQVIGDQDTILPRDAETGEQLYAWSCWEEDAAETFVQLFTLHRDWLFADQLSERIRRRGWVCAEGEEPRPVGSSAKPLQPAAE